MFGMTKQAMPCCGGNGDHIGNCHARVQMKRSTTEDYPPIDLSAMLQAGSAPAYDQLARDIDAARGVKPYEAMADELVGGAVNHPKHYNKHPSGIECIDVVEHMGFNLGNAIKYIWRSDLKGDAIEDLKKALWYIEREIKKRAR